MKVTKLYYNLIVVGLLIFTLITGFMVSNYTFNKSYPDFISIYTKEDIYHIDLKNRVITTETYRYDIQFDDFNSLGKWIEQQTADDLVDYTTDSINFVIKK